MVLYTCLSGWRVQVQVGVLNEWILHLPEQLEEGSTLRSGRQQVVEVGAEILEKRFLRRVLCTCLSGWERLTWSKFSGLCHLDHLKRGPLRP